MVPEAAKDMAQVHGFITISRKRMQDHRELVLAILHKGTGEFLGICGLHARTQPDIPELGIWLKKSAHGQKYGREAIKYLVEWVREHLNVQYFQYPVDKNNWPSRKTAESLGGVIIREGKQKTMSGKLLDEVVYQIR